MKYHPFGPANHWLSPLIQKTIPHKIVEALRDPAKNHDDGYAGKRETGFFGWVKNWLNRKKIDETFHDEMIDNIYDVSLQPSELEEALQYADLAYHAVRVGGWAFYRVDK